MDIHRCRFVPYQPSAVNAVAFSHPYSRSAKQTSFARLAVGRANGDIEIWNPVSGSWHQELVIRGGKDRSIDGLVWVNEPNQDLGQGRTLFGRSRLFSIGYTSSVTEWDLEKGKPKRHASGQHGDIWCIAAQPQGDSSSEVQPPNKLVAGTIDGELVIYSIEDDDLRFQRVMIKSPTKKAQMVSITFQTRQVVIVGCSDSTLRAYDITKGQALRRMTLGSDLVGGSKDIIVWSVKCLPNGSIVSGDSTGQVCIWDGKTYTQVQRIQSHKQDVLSLTVSADGQAIMSGGMDRRTVLYKPTASGGQRWSKVWGRKYHGHDVKTMATFEAGRTGIVLSGGPDANLVAIPFKEIGREHHRTLSNLPQQCVVASASQARFMVSWWEREVHVWVLRKSATDIFGESAENAVDINENRKLLKTIVIKGDSNISSATMNPEGTILCVSTATDVKAFRLEHHEPANPSDVKVSSIKLPQQLCQYGASLVRLSPDSRWLLLVQQGSRVCVAKMESTTTDESSYNVSTQRLRRLRRNIPRYVVNGGLGAYDRNITQVDFSPDSKMVATADLAGYIDTWVLQDPEATAEEGSGAENGDDVSSSDSDTSGDESEMSGERWVRNPAGKLLPKLPASPVVLSFSGHVPGEQAGQSHGDAANITDYTLLVITSAWHMLALHPRQGALTPWSRRHPKENLPLPIQNLLDIAKGVLWQGSRVWIYGVSFLLMVDMNQDLPRPSAHSDATNEQANKHGVKRKRNGLMHGAGGKELRDNVQPHRVRKHLTNGLSEDIEMGGGGEAVNETDSNSDDDMLDVSGGELADLRNRTGEDSNSLEVAEGDTPRRSWWITYKYRPILGVVPLTAAESNGEDSLEVALVERPLWDVELTDSYYTGEPWEKR